MKHFVLLTAVLCLETSSARAQFVCPLYPAPLPPPPPPVTTGVSGSATGVTRPAAPAPAAPSSPATGAPSGPTAAPTGSVLFPAATGGAPRATPTGGGSAPTPAATGGGISSGITPGGVTGGSAPATVGTGVTGWTAASAGIDWTTWEYWWQYNREDYLNVRRHLDATAAAIGTEASLHGSGAWRDVAERVLQAIEKRLESAPSTEESLSALFALARACDGDLRARAAAVVARCVAHEADGNRSISEGAVMALGVLGDDAAIGELRALLDDTAEARRHVGKAVPERMRALAAFSLGLLAARSSNEDVHRFVAHHLARQLEASKSATPDAQAACSIALGLLPAAAVEPTMPGAGTTRDQNARFMLGRADFDAADLQILTGLLSNEHAPTYVRAHVPQALARRSAGGASAPEVTKLLLARLADGGEKAEVVQGCTQALGAMSDASDQPLSVKVREALMRQADTGDVQARCFALVALAQNAGRGEPGIGVEQARARFVGGIQRGHGRERAWSALALGILERARAVDGLPDADAAKVLASGLREARSPDEVGAFATGCGLAGGPLAEDALLARLPTVQGARTRGYLRVALGLMRSEKALTPLRAELESSRRDAEGLPSAALALALLEDPMLVPRLVEFARTSTSQPTMVATLLALGAVGDRRAVEPILEMVEDPDRSAVTRAMGIGALGRICDRDALPWQQVVSRGLNYGAMTATLSADDQGGVLDAF